MSLWTYFYLVFTLLPVLLADCPDSSVGPRRLQETALDPVPWLAIIYSKKPDSWVATCSATLVSPTHLVTAAHCFLSANNSHSINPALYDVAVGKQCADYDTIEHDMQMLRVKQVTLHPWYSSSSCASHHPHDIAVVELKTAVNITAAVSLANIDRSESVVEDLPAGSLGTVAVWEGTEHRNLSSVQLPYVDFHACADLVHARHGLVPSLDKFCAGSENVNRSMCSWDSGAGFVVQHPTTNVTFLRGVLSTDFRPTDNTEDCIQYNMAGFTNIAEPATLQWLARLVPAPPVPCPPVETSVSVYFVYCHRDDKDVDCTHPMMPGTTATSVCSPGYHTTTRRKSKTATCGEDGIWTNVNDSCVQVSSCRPSPCGLHSQCVDVGGEPECSCDAGYIGQPPRCRPECEDNAACADTQVCTDNNSCVEACSGACGMNASCTAVNHSATCTCVPGYTGDARAGCNQIPLTPCPAVTTSTAAQSVICLLEIQLVDCSSDMAPGSLAVSQCSQGFLAGNTTQKMATCQDDGSWFHADVTCQQAPSGYQQLPGLDHGYKFHNVAVTWPEAKSMCERDGAHLAIINSEVEAAALVTLHKQNGGNIQVSYQRAKSWVGVKESDTTQGEFRTVLGEPLSSTGFTRLSDFSNYATLGDFLYFHTGQTGGLGDYQASSNVKLSYVCELRNGR